MPVPSLTLLATRACIKNIKDLTDVGDFEYWKIQEVLQRVPSAAQLHQIEENSPQIKGEDGELWQKFIKKEIPNWKTKNYAPKDPTKWYEVYCKYKREQEKEIERDREALRASFLGLQKTRDEKKAVVKEIKDLPKLPREMRNAWGVSSRGKALSNGPASALSWNAGSRTKMTDGASVLTRARREAAEIKKRTALSRPTAELSGNIRQVRKAPAGMVNEYKTAAQPAFKILARHKNTAVKGPVDPLKDSLRDREQRLRDAMKGKKRSAPEQEATLIGSSDDEFGKESSVDDLFEESPEPPTKKARISPPSSQSSTASSVRPSIEAIPRSSKISRPSGSTPSKPRQLPRTSPVPGAPKPLAPLRRRPEVDPFNRRKRPVKK